MLMPRRPPDELAIAYLKHSRTKSQEDAWAWREVERRVSSSEAEPEDALAVVLALVEAVDDGHLGYVGAGPLEDFVHHFGAAAIDRLEEHARRSPKFRMCLGTIYLSHGSLPPAILERVVRASDGQIKLLGTPPE